MQGEGLFISPSDYNLLVYIYNSNNDSSSNNNNKHINKTPLSIYTKLSCILFILVHHSLTHFLYFPFAHSLSSISSLFHVPDSNCSDAALDLLKGMLEFDPGARISVLDSLSHPFLARYHDEATEPACSLFNFDFEVRAHKNMCMST